MALVELETRIRAPVERVFDLARSIDAHSRSTTRTREVAIAGRTRGLIEMDETVTWEATHFFVRQRLTSKITGFDRPRWFQDTMLQGAFAHMHHDHWFEHADGLTLMKDRMEFYAPLGPLGRLVDRLVLHGYMARFLESRNAFLKDLAEGEGWKAFLSSV